MSRFNTMINDHLSALIAMHPGMALHGSAWSSGIEWRAIETFVTLDYRPAGHYIKTCKQRMGFGETPELAIADCLLATVKTEIEAY